MRLDARKGDLNWWVYHAEECRMLKSVVWIDDETNEWFEYCMPLRAVGNEVDGRLQKARKIAIYADRKLVIINPVEDENGKEITINVMAADELSPAAHAIRRIVREAMRG